MGCTKKENCMNCCWSFKHCWIGTWSWVDMVVSVVGFALVIAYVGVQLFKDPEEREGGVGGLICGGLILLGLAALCFVWGLLGACGIANKRFWGKVSACRFINFMALVLFTSVISGLCAAFHFLFGHNHVRQCDMDEDDDCGDNHGFDDDRWTYSAMARYGAVALFSVLCALLVSLFIVAWLALVDAHKQRKEWRREQKADGVLAQHYGAAKSGLGVIASPEKWVNEDGAMESSGSEEDEEKVYIVGAPFATVKQV